MRRCNGLAKEDRHLLSGASRGRIGTPMDLGRGLGSARAFRCTFAPKPLI